MNSVAERYAEALFELAVQEDSVDLFLEQMMTVKEVMEENPRLSAILSHSQVSKEEKKDIFKHAFENFHPMVYHFLLLLVDKGRTNYLIEMCKVFRTMCFAHKGIVEGIVYTPYTLSEEEVSALEGATEHTLRRKVALVQKKDPSLIAGVKIVVEGKVIDGSLKKKMETMRLSLLESR